MDYLLSPHGVDRIGFVMVVTATALIGLRMVLPDRIQNFISRLVYTPLNWIGRHHG